MRPRTGTGQLTLGHADPSYAEVCRTVLEQVRTAEDELAEAQAWADSFGIKREFGAKDLLKRAQVRHAIVTGRAPESVGLVLVYQHGWLEGIEDLAPPNPARTSRAPASAQLPAQHR
ncbi:hypothetical protein ACWFMI_23905 [Nocardiopsis terrae]|uniref:hypothetical protein n=1 Tax=Streptomyces sp. NPDC057554 TaxID=3350538 RepID=UPI003682DC38